MEKKQTVIEEMSPPMLNTEQREVDYTNYEKILSETKNSLIQHIQRYSPEFNQLAESDPMSKIIEIAAYRELLVRQKIKDTIKLSLFSQATGDSLNKLAHLILDDEKTAQDDLDVKNHIDEFWNQTPYYTTGTEASYKYFIKKYANEKIRDISVAKNKTGITIYILLNENYLETNNNEDERTKLKVELQQKIEDENIRRITDKINIAFAEKTYYTIKATLTLSSYYDLEDIEEDIKNNVSKITNKLTNLDTTISTKLFFKAFYIKGVTNVVLKLIKLNKTADEAEEIIAKESEALIWNKAIEFTLTKNKDI